MSIDVINLGIEDSLKEKLDKYLEILIFWQKSINLISNDTIDDAMIRHFYDSLQILKYVKSIEQENNWDKESINIFDLGSGAGFPGLVLAIADPKNKYYLIESNSKKTSFLLEIIRNLSLNNVIVINERLETFANDTIKAKLIISRGLMKLSNLIESSQELGVDNFVGIFLKGKNYQQEIDDVLSNNKEAKLEIHTKNSLTSNDSKIIIVKKI